MRNRRKRQRSSSRGRRKQEGTESVGLGRPHLPGCSSSAATARPKKVNSFRQRRYGIITRHTSLAVIVLLGITGFVNFLKADRKAAFITSSEQSLIRQVEMYMNSTFFLFKAPLLGPQIVSFWMHWHNDTRPKIDLVAHIRIVASGFSYLNIFVLYSVVANLTKFRIISVVSGIAYFAFGDLLRFANSGLFFLHSIESFFVLLALLVFVQLKRGSGSCTMFWTFLATFLLSIALCFAYSAPLSLLFVLFVRSLLDIWKLLDDTLMPLHTILWNFLANVLIFTCLPLLIYSGVVWIHLSSLTKSGPDARILSTDFQSSLESEFSTVTARQPQKIVSGSRITLRNTDSKQPCWLHSEETVYPVNYDDGRGSSHQQIVSCYLQKHMNNWWFVTSADVTDGPIRSGDEVQLIHGLTRRLLNSHDVAAPRSSRSQEVSCYIDYNVSMEVEPNWKLVVVNENDVGAEWRTIWSKVQFVHSNSGQILRTTGRKLPDWAPGDQLEVAADSEGALNLWNVEEHKNEGDSKSKAVKQKTETLGFWTKFWEMHERVFFYPKQDDLDFRTYDFSIWDVILVSVPTEVLFLRQNSTDFQPYESHFIHPNLIAEAVIRIGTVLSAILWLGGILLEHRYCTSIDGFQGVFMAWRTVGAGLLAIIAPYLYYERPIYAEEFHILSIFSLILTVVFVDSLYQIFLSSYPSKLH